MALQRSIPLIPRFHRFLIRRITGKFVVFTFTVSILNHEPQGIHFLNSLKCPDGIWKTSIFSGQQNLRMASETRAIGQIMLRIFLSLCTTPRASRSLGPALPASNWFCRPICSRRTDATTCGCAQGEKHNIKRLLLVPWLFVSVRTDVYVCP